MMKDKLLIGLGLLTLALTSCEDKDLFDQASYDQARKEAFGIDNVDPKHNWATVGKATANIKVIGDYGTTYEVGIYQENPIGAKEATLLYEEVINGTGTLTANVSYPLAQSIVYVGVFDKDGRGMAKAVKVANGNIDATIEMASSAASRAARRATSTNRADYIRTDYKTFFIDDLKDYDKNFSSYYDMTKVPQNEQLNKQVYTAANNWQGGPAYGDGMHFVLPAKKTYTISSNTFVNAWDATVIVVRGTLIVPENFGELRLWGDGNTATSSGKGTFTHGQTIVVAEGGKLICNNNKLTFANKANIINYGSVELNGTYVDYANGADKGFMNAGTIKGTNGAGINFAGGTPYYNCGDMDLSDNGFIRFNGNITFTNVGHIHAYNCADQGATKVNDWAISAGAQNATVYNLCDMTYERFFGVNNYVGTDGSLLYAKEGMFTNSGGSITLGSQAMVKCGDWYDNGSTAEASNLASNYAIIQVTGDVDEQTGQNTKATGYVYFDIQGTIKGQGEDNPNNYHVTNFKNNMLTYTVHEASAPNNIMIPADEDGCNTIGYNSNGNEGGGKPDTDSFSMRYCFEDNFPDFGDYDFNDVVLTLTPTVNGNTLNIKVSLDAVGASESIAAAIRLVGVNTTHLSGYYAVQEFEPLPSNMASVANITTDKTFITESDEINHTTDLVIVLFKDAHWAINPQRGSNGKPLNVFYNTVTDPNYPNAMSIDPKVAEFELVFNDPKKAASIAENNFDVFIVEPYNSGYWEVHTVQNGFKCAQVLTTLKGSDYSRKYGDNIPWAIMTSGKDFRYPIEWQNIGQKKGSTLTGAYKTPDHAFGSWAENPESNKDWYKYPTEGLVY
jgi:LruC domain-containing protein